MTTIKDLYNYLDAAFPQALSCPWDNDGLMLCGDREKEVKRVLCTLDVTEKTIAEAIDLGCDCMISHHPMIFKKMAAVNDGDFHGRRIIDLLSHGISVMSFHTRLDAVEGGVNDELCREDGDPVVNPLCLCPEPGRFPIAVLLRLFDLVEGMRQRVFFFRKLQKLSSQNSAI